MTTGTQKNRSAAPQDRRLWAPMVAVIAGLLAVSIVQPPVPGQTGTVANFVSFLAFVGSFSIVGALIAAKRPGHPIGWLLLGAALCYAVGGAAVSLPVQANRAGSISPSILLAWAGTWSWGVGVGLAVIALLLFPDGGLPSRRWRPVLWIAIVAIVVFVLGMGFGRPTIDGETRNPFAIGGPVGPILRGLLGEDPETPLGAFAVIMLTAPLAVLAIGSRFRRSRGAEREQIKWLLFAGLIVGVGFLVPIAPIGLGSDDTNALITGSLATIPAAIGIAILRYRLWDIDRIVSRTLGWGIVTAVLVSVFGIAVVGFEDALAWLTQGRTLAVAGSTLLAFALFQPLHRRVQSAVDRWFNRRRYDADRVLAAYAESLRGTANLGEITNGAVALVARSLGPRDAAMWIRSSGRGEA